MRRPALLLLAILPCLVLCAQAGKYSFSKLDIYNGLSHNQVNTILKDNTGFLWFGTMSGLNRYDSYGFKVFRHSAADTTSINDNYISGIYQLPGNDLWVNTRSGGNIYQSKTEKFERNFSRYLLQHSLPSGTIRSVIRDRQGDFWFAYDSLGVYRYSTATGKTKGYSYSPSANNGPATSQLSGIRADAQGYIWMVHRNGIVEKMDPASGKIMYRNNELNRRNATLFNYDLFVDREGQVWLWTLNEANGAFLLDPAKGVITNFSETGPGVRINNNLITGVIQDGKGIIWIGTDHGGINLFDKTTGRVSFVVSDPKDPRSLAQNSIYSIYKDDSGMIWVGTFKQGINYLDENIARFAHYRHKDGDPSSLPADDVNAFVEDGNGNLWIGTNGSGLIFFDRKKQQFRNYRHDPANP
ncbi:MAG: hybrid sensor histidine kinase/response regulator, partial [Chitinophagaceae bacterium]